MNKPFEAHMAARDDEFARVIEVKNKLLLMFIQIYLLYLQRK